MKNPSAVVPAEMHDAFAALRAAAREHEPTSWWLQQTELTTLGYEAIVAEITRHLETEHPMGDARLLDWGAGPGFTTFMFERAGVSCVYYDFKYDFPSYRHVLDQLDSQKVYISDEKTRLPFDDESFDCVVSCGVLEHVPDPEGSISEIMRVLRPGGVLFIYHFPNRYSYTEALAGVIGQDNHEVRWSKRELTRKLTAAGFGIEWFDYRYMIPRNLVSFPRVRDFFSRHAPALYRFDRHLSRIPGLNAISNALNCMARKPGA